MKKDRHSVGRKGIKIDIDSIKAKGMQDYSQLFKSNDESLIKETPVIKI